MTPVSSAVRPHAFPGLCLFHLCSHIPPKTKKTSDKGARAMPQENVAAAGRTVVSVKGSLPATGGQAPGHREKVPEAIFLINVH